MTTSRKFYLAVLMVAVAALVWDKASNNDAVTQPRPSFAGNMPVSNQPAGSSRTRETVENTPAFSPGGISRTEQLSTDNINEQSYTQPIPDERIFERDLFVATETFHQGLQDKAKQKTDALPEDLQPCFNLSGIFIGPRLRYALFGEKLVLTGQYIGPYRVLQINRKDVVLETDSDPITLYWK
jgi:hypothetical protein